MTVIPVTLKPQEVHFDADPALAFQVVTAFGVSGPNGRSPTRVLQEEEGRLLVEFHGVAKNLLGKPRPWRTVEWVTLHEPGSIDFAGVEGPFTLLRDRFTFIPVDGCTVLRYESTIGWRGWIVGWLAAQLLAKPVVKRHMRSHLAELKQTIEARAQRSKLFPDAACKHGAPVTANTGGG